MKTTRSTPSETPVAPRVVEREIPRPLLRSNLTFNPDRELGDPVTIQVVITDYPGKRGFGQEEDFPELQEAGWGCHVLSNYAVHFRIVN